MRRIMVIVLVGCALTLVSARTNAQEARIGIAQDWRGDVHDIARAPAALRSWLFLWLEPLIGRDAQGLFTPLLAEAWELNDARQRLTLGLKSGVNFHDGSPFNAHVAKQNLERAKRIGWTQLGQISVVDDSTIDVSVGTGSTRALLTALSQIPMVPENAIGQDPIEVSFPDISGTGWLL